MLTAADSVLIPIQCEYYALEGLSQLLNTVKLVQRNFNPALAIDGVLLTMFDARLNLSKQVADEAKEYFGAQMFGITIPRNVRLAEAPSFGKPILLYDVQSVGAKSYLAVAQELDRKSTRLNSSHGYISYAVFCLKKKKNKCSKWTGSICEKISSPMSPACRNTQITHYACTNENLDNRDMVSQTLDM